MIRALAAALLATALFFVAPSALAEPIRLLIAAGNKQGLAAERPLKFADNDAKRVRDVMIALGGVKSEHATYLAEPTRGSLFAALDKAKGEALRHRPDEVTLLFYFSGHGDREALHLGGDRILITELSQKIQDVPAGLRIAVTDACRATRDKGFGADEPFAISTTVLPQATGQVWLHASSDGEAAQESDELQGAIFTHAWLSGLRGAADANGDARVTLDESFAFAHSQTLIRSSKSSGVMQKPEAVVNLREAAPVVITQTAVRMATLALPQARDTHFLVYTAGGKSVLSELWSSPDRRLALSVPPGRYVVQRRLAGAAATASIAVGAGEERKLEEKDFTAQSLELVAKKGEEPDAVVAAPDPNAHRHDISAGWDAGADARVGFSHGPRAAWAYQLDRLALTIGGGLNFASRTLEEKDESLTTGYGRAGVELRLPLATSLVLRAGGGVRAGGISQSVVVRDPSRARVGTAIESTKIAFTFGPEVTLGARLLLGRTFFVDLSATGALALLQEEEKLRGVLGIAGALAIGARF